MNGNGRIDLFNDFSVDLARGCVTRSGEEVHLRPQTYQVLTYLIENRGHLISKDRLIEEVWKGRAVTDGSLSKCIEELRHALGPEAREFIRNIHGRGYILDTAVEEKKADVLPSRAEQIDVVRVTIEEHEETEALSTATLSVNMTSSEKTLRKATAAVGILVIITGIAFAYRYFSNRADNLTPINSIAVLPFRNEAADSEVEYLSDGMTESLINRLSQLPQIKVIAHNSIFRYKDKQINAPDVARTLGVQAILVGRVTRFDNDLTVSVELIDARDNTQVWGEKYTRRATDIQAIQEQIAHTISEKLRVKLTGSQEQQLSKHATQNSQAYQFYLNGLFHFRKRQPADVRKALDYFERARTLDPSFALAWVAEARTNRYLAGNSLFDPRVAITNAKTATQRALELDESLAEAHVVLAGIKSDEWDWSGAEREYKRAIELNLNLVEAHIWYAEFMSLMERHDEALKEIQLAQDLDPLANLKSREAWALLIARRADEAIEIYRNISPSHFMALGFAYELKGDYQQAIEKFQKGIDVVGATNNNSIYLGYSLAMSGRKAEARAILERVLKSKEYFSPEEMAGLYVSLGDKEGAFAMLERAYAEHDLQLKVIRVDWRLDPLRSDPRFQDLLKRLGIMNAPAS